MIISLMVIHGVSGSFAMGETFYPISSISSNTAGTDFYPAVRLIEGAGVGFDFNEPHDRAPGFAESLWVTDACGYPCDYFETELVPVLTIDLGEDRELAEISVWGYSDTNRNGARKLEVRFATEADGPAGFGTSILGSRLLTSAVQATTRQSFAFGEVVKARYVEVTITDNYFLAPGFDGGDRVGLGEIAFAVPQDGGEGLLVTAPNQFALVGGGGDGVLDDLLVNENYWSVERSVSRGKAYLSSPTAGKIFVMNLTDATPGATVFVDDQTRVFHGLAVDDDGGVLYALDSANDDILVYDLDSGALTRTISANLMRPNEIVFDSVNERLLVSDSGLDQLKIFSVAGTLLRTVSGESTMGIWGLALEPGTGDILFGSHDRGEIFRLAGSGQGTPVMIYNSLSGPRGLGFDRRGRLFCVESGTGEVKILGADSGVIFAPAAGGRDVALLVECDLNENFLPDDWEGAQGGPAISFHSDGDQDGLIAGIEAALGGSPTDGTDGTLKSVFQNEEGEFEIEHLALLKSDFNYRLWFSTDLESWQRVRSAPAVEQESGLYDRWRYLFSPAGEGLPADVSHLFFRIEVATFE